MPAAKVKFSIDPAAVNDLELGEQVMLGARSVIKNVTNEYGMYIDMKSYSTMYSYYEMVGITFDETIVNLITSAIAVMIVLFCLLPPGPSILAVLNVLLADICILAWVPLTGLNLNAITSTCMVMSVGIAVDFSAHITHAFVETDGSLSGKERAALAVTKMGRSLTTSALTTFMSVLMLSTVTVPSNRMFFVMMSGVTLFGLLFGMLLLPTVLSFFNPGYEAPVPVFTPITPMKPGEEAERLDKMRSRGVRRHHRKHHSNTSDVEEEGNGKGGEKGEGNGNGNGKEEKGEEEAAGEKKEGENGVGAEKEKEKTKQELKELEMKTMSKEGKEKQSEKEEQQGERKESPEGKPNQGELHADTSLEDHSADMSGEIPQNPSSSEPLSGAEEVSPKQSGDVQPEPRDEGKNGEANETNEINESDKASEPANLTPEQAGAPAATEALNEESHELAAKEPRQQSPSPTALPPHEDTAASPQDVTEREQEPQEEPSAESKE